MRHIASRKEQVFENFFNGFSSNDREKICIENFSSGEFYSELGHSEVVGMFGPNKLMRICFAGLHIVKEIDIGGIGRGTVTKVQVAHFNQRYLLIGFEDGTVEMRDTETLEKVFFK